MRISAFKLGIFACFVAIVAAWSKEDQEIFRLRDEVELSEGPGVSFYDFVGTHPGANQDEINKAYRKRSKVLHPDKVKQQFIASKSTGKDKTKGKKPGVNVSKGPTKAEIEATAKAASDRFARLGIVTNILRGPGRERYDHFLSNGFPKWKGTGYYYARFRPGLGSVLLGLFIAVGGGGHWIFQYTSWKRRQEFAARYIKFARHAAWGDNLNIPGLDSAATAPVATGGDDSDAMQPVNRRQRRMQEKEAKKDKSEKKPKGVKAPKASPSATPAASTGARKRVVAENGKMLIVDSVGNVFVEQANEDGEMEEYLIDPSEDPQPTIRGTLLFTLPMSIANLVISRISPKKDNEDDEESIDEEIDTPGSSGSGADDSEALDKAKTSGSNKALRRKKSTTRGR